MFAPPDPDTGTVYILDNYADVTYESQDLISQLWVLMINGTFQRI